MDINSQIISTLSALKAHYRRNGHFEKFQDDFPLTKSARALPADDLDTLLLMLPSNLEGVPAVEIKKLSWEIRRNAAKGTISEAAFDPKQAPLLTPTKF